MLGISAVGVATGSKQIDNVARAQELGKTDEFITQKVGFTTLLRKDDDVETSDLCVAAYRDLVDQTGIEIGEVDCIVVCTQNPDGEGLPHTSARLQAKLHASDRVAAFDLSLGCSGFVYGLSVIIGFMEQAGLKKGLLFTADPYSKIVDFNDAATELLFGDGASCTLISETPVYSLGRSCFGTNGIMGDALIVDSKTKKLYMNGRAIFNFTMRVVPGQISECLRKNSLVHADVNIYLLHQASKYIIENMAKKLDISHGKAPFELGDVGNVVSSTIPFLLKQNICKDHEVILLSGFGVGLSWASTILKRV